MIFNNQEQTILLILRSFTSGLVLGVLYDIFAVAISKLGRRRMLCSVLTFVFDFCFCILCACTSLLLMFYANKGFFRFFVFVFMVLGFVAMRASLGILIRKLLSVVYDILLKPVIFVKNKIILIYHLTICRILGKIKERVKEARRKRAERAKTKMTVSKPEPEKEEEDVVYVAKGTAYRRNGRIKF